MEILSLSLPREREILRLKQKDAVSLLGGIELQPSPEPSSDSVARMGFDPYITRRLFTFMPLRVLELPPQERTWEVLRSLFDGLEELHGLTGATNLTTWQVGRNIRLPDAALTSQVSKVVGDVKVWKHVRNHQLAYVRTTHTVRTHTRWLSTALTSPTVIFRQRYNHPRNIPSPVARG